MNPTFYIATDPWSEAVALAKKGELGRIVAGSVQEYCISEPVADRKASWIERWEEVLGSHRFIHALEVGDAASVLLTFTDDAIVRIFIDSTPGDPVVNFEMVGTERLLIWKPDVRALSITQSASECHHTYSHDYAVDLERRVRS